MNALARRTRRLRTLVGLGCLAALAQSAAPLVPVASGALRFSAAVVPVSVPPQRIEIADLDGDDDVDLALLATSPDGSALISLRNERGSFAPHWQTDLVAAGPDLVPELELGDLDADGDLDLVHLLPVGNPQSHLNAGDGSFPTSIEAIGAGGTTTISLADLDADGALDLAYHVFDLIGYIGVQPGNQDGSFAFLLLETVGGPSTYVARSALCESTGDAQLDLVLASSFGLQLAPGKLAGGFPEWQNPTQLLVAGTFLEVEAVDLDRDGDTDLVASQPTLDRLCILRAQSSGGFAPPEFVAFGLQPESIAVADLDGDGSLDLAACSSRRAGRVCVRTASASGGWEPLWQLPVARSARDIDAADLDGDGDNDLVVADSLGSQLVLLENQLNP